ncbi:Ger(x)C family spore germination protein [Paenibacillus filicis]|uniref:Ger(X)C family spore germination protein n=1 Tax=Paenibacillus filicis TaxID=669464 RepID=A0ABU9DIX2_9BACL
MQRIRIGMVAGVLLVTLLTGCWNRRELNELGILSGAAIDKIGNQYQVSAQVVIPDQVSSRSKGGKAPVTLYKASAPTLFEAFRNLTTTSPRKIYTAQIQVLILGESVAQEGVAKVLDLLVRNPETRMNYAVFVAKKTSAESILKVLTPLEKIPADSLYNSLETSSKVWAPITKVTVDILIDHMTGKGIHPVLPGVTIIYDAKENPSGDETKTDYPEKPQLSGLAIFKKDKLVGWLGPNEGKGYNYITNKVKTTVGNLKCSDGNLLALEIISSHTDLKCRLVNGKPVIEVQVETEANVGEVTCSMDVTSPLVIEELEKKGAEKANELMKHTVEVMQKQYKTDIFGFGQAIYKTYPELWKRLEDDWDERFADLKVVYKTKLHIRNTGMTSNSLENIMKEK